MFNYLKYLLCMCISSTVLLSQAYAGGPLWTFATVSGFPPAITIGAASNATIRYTVTNQSKKTHTLQMTPIQGISPSGCSAPLGFHESCTLNLAVNGSALRGNVIGGPVLCEQGNPLQCYQPSQPDSLAIHLSQEPPTLTASISTLALSVNCPQSSSCNPKNAALTGNPRQITIQNTGSSNATNVSANLTEPLPTGTTITTNTCTGTLNAGSSCTITITPGVAASSNCTNGAVPVPGTVTITADGGLSTSVNIYVLSYGCQYEGGFIYSVNDSNYTTPNTSIGGKVASLVDQASSPNGTQGIVWSSNGISSPTSYSYDIIPWIADTNPDYANSANYPNAKTYWDNTYTEASRDSHLFPSQSAFTSTCDGPNDGKCNTGNILVFYNAFNTNYGIDPFPYTLQAGPTTLTNYAAGLCSNTINTYSDWYLPAICELDNRSNSQWFTCSTQSMLSSLSFLVVSCTPPSGTQCLAGYYWSSTEVSVSPQSVAWLEFFSSGGSSQYDGNKVGRLGVRCSRAF